MEFRLEVLGDAPVDDYPLQPKKHSLEFLREIAHLRPRTNTFSAVFRVRHALSFAIHNYFNKEGFVNWHSPIITGSDAEGAGEMFRVSTLPASGGEVAEDFFGKETHLTVSGQLEGELGALALGKIYTFGPTFRAENSNTTRHLAGILDGRAGDGFLRSQYEHGPCGRLLELLSSLHSGQLP